MDEQPFVAPAIAPDPDIASTVAHVVRLNPKADLDQIEPGLAGRWARHISQVGGDHALALVRLNREQRAAAETLRVERSRRSSAPETALDMPLPPERTPDELHASRMAALMRAAELDDSPELRRLLARLEESKVPKAKWPDHLANFATRILEQRRWAAATEDIMSRSGILPDDPAYRALVRAHEGGKYGLQAWVRDLAALALKRMKQDGVPSTVVAQEGRGRQAIQGPKAAEVQYRQDLAAARGDWRKVWEAKVRAREAGFDVH